MKLLATCLIFAVGFTAAALDSDSMMRLSGRYFWQNPDEAEKTRVIDLHANGSFTITELENETPARVAVGEWKWAGSTSIGGKKFQLFCLMNGEKVTGSISFADHFMHPEAKDILMQKEETTANGQLLATYRRVVSSDSSGWWRKPFANLLRQK